MYGRSVTLLRQIATMVDDTGIDMVSLRSETIGISSDPSSTITMNSPAPATTAAKWRDLLAAVSPTAVQFGVELARVDQYLKQRMSSIVQMQRTIWALEAMVVFLIVLAISKTLQRAGGDLAGKDLGGVSVTLGVVTAMTLLMLAVFGCWSANINEMYRKLSAMQSSPLLSVLQGFGNALAGQQIVHLMAAVADGTDVAEAIRAFAPPGYPVQCKTVSEGAAKAGTYTMAYMVPVIQEFCSSPLIVIAEALADLQQNGVDRYDENSLWTGVRDGVDALRRLVLVEYDTGDPARTLTRDAVAEVVRTQVLPVLQLPGVVLKGQFVPSNAVLQSDGFTIDVTKADAVAGLKQVGDPFGAGRTQPRCTRTCLSAGTTGTCVMSYFEASTATCYSSTTYGPFKDAFIFTGRQSGGTSPTTPGPLAGTMLIVRPADFGAADHDSAKPIAGSHFDSLVDGPPRTTVACEVTGLAAGAAAGAAPPAAVSDGDFASFFSPKVAASVPNVSQAYRIAFPTTVGALFEYALKSPGAAAGTLEEQASDIAHRLFLVVKEFRFALDLDHVRGMIDAGLAPYYGGTAFYVSGGVSAAVDKVMQRLRALVLASRRLGTFPRFVTPERLRVKLLAMSGDDVSDLQTTMQSLHDCAATHLQLFPAYRSAAAPRVAAIVSVLGGLTLTTAFVTYALVTFSLFRKHGALTFEGLAQRIVVGLCVMVIIIFVAETMAHKAAARIAHNQGAIDDNGAMLVGAANKVNVQLARVLSLIGALPDAPPVLGSDAASTRAECTSLLSSVENTVVRYEACNSITSGQVGMPVPYAEIALYGIIAATFVVLAAVCVLRIAPMERIDSIRALSQLKTRLLRGDVGAAAEAAQVVTCARPQASAWTFFVWFAILLLVTLTAWFAVASNDVVSDYADSLAALGPACTDAHGRDG